MTTTHPPAFGASRGVLAALRGLALLALCLGLAAGFLAEVWHGPGATATGGASAPSTAEARTVTPVVASPARS